MSLSPNGEYNSYCFDASADFLFSGLCLEFFFIKTSKATEEFYLFSDRQTRGQLIVLTELCLMMSHVSPHETAALLGLEKIMFAAAF